MQKRSSCGVFPVGHGKSGLKMNRSQSLTFWTVCVKRGCFRARPPASLHQILTDELFEAIRSECLLKVARHNWILDILKRYKTSVEFGGVASYGCENCYMTGCPSNCLGCYECNFRVTVLGLLVMVGDLELIRVVLNPGANIEVPIEDGY
jgi:hypothetical protein